MSFPNYPEYKDSGAEWLGDSPEHWQVFSGKRIFSNSRASATPQAEQLAATQAYGVIPQKEFMEQQGHKLVLALSGTGGFKDVQAGDFVISLRSFQGGLEYSAHDGCVSPAYTVLRPTYGTQFYPSYFKHLLKANEYIAALQSVTTGIREGRTITYDQFGSIILPVPTLQEQTQIAHFLDHETARIDALIEEQQRLIKLLKEKRQAVISHAVTKGLDPTVPMKDSGVEWLGEVPAHWRVSKLGHYAQILTGFPFPSVSFSHEESDVRLLRGANIGVGFLKWTDTVYWNLSEDDSLSDYLMEEGQIVLGMDRPWVSEGMRIARVTQEDMPCLLLQRVAVITPGGGLEDEYLFYLLASELFKTYVEPDLTGVSVPHISPEQIMSFQISVPEIGEQRRISSFIRNQLDQMSALFEQASESVELLQERRSALISAAVTGKIDVRGWHPPVSAPSSELEAEAV